jgi:hypothetical protein
MSSRITVALALLLAACGGGGDARPARLTPAELTFAQEDYAGKLVETGGIVRRFGAREGATRVHMVVEDAAENRVELEGGGAERFEGRSVVVVGRFRFEEGTGRRIEVEAIRER